MNPFDLQIAEFAKMINFFVGALLAIAFCIAVQTFKD